MSRHVRRVLLPTVLASLLVSWWLAQSYASEITVRSVRVMNAQSADETASDAVGSAYMSQCRETAIYVDWLTGVTSGVMQVESSVGDAYAGTWAPLATVTFAGTAPNQDLVQITGVHWALRTRISTVVVGGLVSTWLVCN